MERKCQYFFTSSIGFLNKYSADIDAIRQNHFDTDIVVICISKQHGKSEEKERECERVLIERKKERKKKRKRNEEFKDVGLQQQQHQYNTKTSKCDDFPTKYAHFSK